MRKGKREHMEEFDKLVQIFERLRAPGGCPWDAEQDHKSISLCIIEESYELFEAISHGDKDHMQEELGDVLLQVIFHSIIARDLGEFCLKDVINGLADKLISRHPHVFADVELHSSKEVIRNWEKLKKSEKGKVGRESILDGIPTHLPSILTARKMQSTVSRVGFDWKDARGVMEKIREEIAELEEAIDSKNTDAMEDEIGDLLFSVVNLARKYKVDPEAALRRTNRKFRKRFEAIEKESRRRGVSLEEMDLMEMDQIWERSKHTDNEGEKC
jgi:tetrapyrrole methylase family protein/MazG family protein